MKKTESDILKAAEELFLEKGYEATSTTDIAKVAGCNQALVHYYFRTKEKLFTKIFTEKFKIILGSLKLEKDFDFRASLNHFIDTYFEMLTHNRKIPFFLINELIMREDRRPIIRAAISQEMSYLQYYTEWDKMIKDEISKGNIRQIETMDLTLNVLSLIIFTFISLPLYSDFFEKDENEISHYLQHRKEEVKKLVFQGIGLE